MSRDTADDRQGTARTTQPPRELSTMQRNALRMLLNRRDFRPEDVARLDYATLARAPRIGKKALESIRSWLQAQGYDLRNVPAPESPPARRTRKEKELERALETLRSNGLDITLPALFSRPPG